MFTFKGISSTDMGVFVTEHFPLPVSIERVEEETVPSRDGVVTYSDGSYDGSEIKGKVTVMPSDSSLDQVSDWLRGWGELILPGAPDRMFIARVSNLVPIEQFIQNEVYTFPLSFKCQPFGYLLSGQQEVTLQQGKVTNPGNMPAKPIIMCTGNGAESTIIINGQTLTVVAGSGDKILIDCDNEEVINLTTNKLHRYKGDMPIFNVGENNVEQVSGSFTIKYNWRNK